MKGIKYLSVIFYIIALGALNMPGKSTLKTVINTEKNQSDNTSDKSIKRLKKSYKNIDEKFLIEPKYNCDPKMIIPGDPSIDPKFILDEIP